MQAPVKGKVTGPNPVAGANFMAGSPNGKAGASFREKESEERE